MEGDINRPPQRLSIKPLVEGFGGKDSVKGNRQGSLSRLMKRLFEAPLELQKVQQPVEKSFSTGWAAARKGWGGVSVRGRKVPIDLSGDG